MSKYKVIDLPHGAKLYYAKNRINASTSIEVSFPCGARVDTIPGLAHFTEHMFFSGTDKLTKDEINKKYFDIIYSNAYTNDGRIMFSGDIFTKELDKYLKMVSTLITETTFSSEAVEKEKPIVKQEIAGKKDNFSRKSHFFNRHNIYGDDYIKYMTLGTEDTVDKITDKDVKEYVNKYFVTNNMEIFIATPMNVNKVKKLLINDLVEKMPTREGYTKLPLEFLSVKHDNFFKLETKDIDKNYIYINFAFDKNMYDFSFKRKFGLVLDMLNNETMGLNKELRLKRSLTYYVYINATYLKNSAICVLQTECESKNVGEVITHTAEYFKNLVRDGFTEEQLANAKRLYEYNDMVKVPRINAYFNKFYQLQHYGKILNAKQARKEIKHATLDECNAVMREVFSKPKVSASIYGNIEEKNLMTKQEFKKLFK